MNVIFFTLIEEIIKPDADRNLVLGLVTSAKFKKKEKEAIILNAISVSRDYVIKKSIDLGWADDISKEFYLRSAVFYGKIDIVKMMVIQGTVINNIKHNKDLFVLASENGHLDVLKYLVSKSNSLEFMKNDAFNSACQKGHLNVVKYLVEELIDFEEQFLDGIRNASFDGHTHVIEYLLKEFLKNNHDPETIELVSKTIGKKNLPIFRKLILSAPEESEQVSASNQQLGL